MLLVLLVMLSSFVVSVVSDVVDGVVIGGGFN